MEKKSFEETILGSRKKSLKRPKCIATSGFFALIKKSERKERSVKMPKSIWKPGEHLFCLICLIRAHQGSLRKQMIQKTKKKLYLSFSLFRDF